jgi:DNA replication initiation complex subunit (GINS family)
MSEEEKLRSEIRKMLEEVPDDLLQELRDYLKEVQKQGKDKTDRSQKLRKTLKEDRKLHRKKRSFRPTHERSLFEFRPKETKPINKKNHSL